MNSSNRVYVTVTLIFSLFLLISCATTPEQPMESWEVLDEEYRQAFSDEKYDTAVLRAASSVDAARDEFGQVHFFVAISLNNLSRAHRALGDKEKADQYFDEAIEMTKKILDTDEPEVRAALSNSTDGNPYAKDPYSDFELNTLPYIKWGNTPHDPSSPNDRLEKFYNYFLAALFAGNNTIEE